MLQVEFLGPSHFTRTIEIAPGMLKTFEGGKKEEVEDFVAEICEKINAKSKQPVFRLKSISLKEIEEFQQARFF